MLISIETHITCDFPGGGVWPPYPPSGSAHAGHFKIKIAFLHKSLTIVFI